MVNTDLFLISWAIYTILIVYSWIYLTNQFFSERKYKAYPGCAILFFILYGVYAFISTDYYAYEILIDRVQILKTPLDVEPPYWSIIPFLNYNYTLFRTVLIVPAFIGLYYIFRRFSLYIGISIGLFAICLLYSFTTTIRSSFADVIFFVGALRFINKKSLLNFIICSTTTILACVFHKSGFMLVVPFLLALCPNKKYFIKLLIYLLPISVLIGRVIISIIFRGYFEDSAYQDSGGYGSGSVMLRDYLTNLFLFIMIGYTLWIKRKDLNSKNPFNTYLYNFVFYCSYIWIVLMCTGTSRYVASRFLSHVMIPIVLIIANTVSIGNKRFKTLISILTGLIILVTEFGILTVFRERIG